jgi:aspartate racemase
LQSMGATFLFTICNTAHAFHEEVQRELDIPWVHLMDLTADYIYCLNPKVKKIGILATDGTIRTGLYDEAFSKRGLLAISPDIGSDMQQSIMNSIYHPSFGIKTTSPGIDPRATDNLINGADWCVSRGADIIIMACTEIPLALNSDIYNKVPLVNPTILAAKTLLDLSFGKKDPQEFVRKYI